MLEARLGRRSRNSVRSQSGCWWRAEQCGKPNNREASFPATRLRIPELARAPGIFPSWDQVSKTGYLTCAHHCSGHRPFLPQYRAGLGNPQHLVFLATHHPQGFCLLNPGRLLAGMVSLGPGPFHALPLSQVAHRMVKPREPLQPSPVSLLLLLKRTPRSSWWSLGWEQNRRVDDVKRRVFGKASSLK